MGAQDVGKTALVVRFLTHKYLSEYFHGASTSYERSIPLDGKLLPLRITDASGKESFTSLKGQGLLEGADGFFVAYSITDKRSFFKAKEMLKLLNEDFDTGTPLVLVANKDDLGHLRTVNGMEGQKVGLSYPRCAFHECSAALDVHNVQVAFHDLIRRILSSKDGSKRHHSALSSLRPPKPRRYSAGNSTLAAWWRRSRCSSLAGEGHKDRTFTM